MQPTDRRPRRHRSGAVDVRSGTRRRGPAHPGRL